MISGKWPVFSCRDKQPSMLLTGIAIAFCVFVISGNAIADVWTYQPYALKVTAARFFYLDSPVARTEIKILRAQKKGRMDWERAAVVKVLQTDENGDVTIPKLPKGKYFFSLSTGGRGFLLLFDFRGGNKKRMLVKLRPTNMCGPYFDVFPESAKENGS